MAQLLVTVEKLNRRRSVPAQLPDRNGISGTVRKGFSFEGTLVPYVPNPALGKWYADHEGYVYWAGGLTVLSDHPHPPLAGLPAGLPLPYKLGIDVSHHNIISNWKRVKQAGIDFVYIKSAEGVGSPDLEARQHAQKAIESGLRIGFYHFCRPDAKYGRSVVSDALAEADDALGRIAAIATPHLPLVLDLEDQTNWDTPLDKIDYTLWVNTFIDRVKQKTARAPMIYSRREYLDRKLKADHGLGMYKLWLSRYTTDISKTKCPLGWADWSVWQYTETGVLLPGTHLDINVMKDPSLF